MKKIIALLLVAVMCFSLAACGNSSKLEKYKKYEALINYMEAGDYESGLAEMIRISENGGSVDNAGDESGEKTAKAVEISIDNWQEYFEIVDGLTLQKISAWKDAPFVVGCITVYCGVVRLIDNIKYKE